MKFQGDGLITSLLECFPREPTQNLRETGIRRIKLLALNSFMFLFFLRLSLLTSLLGFFNDNTVGMMEHLGSYAVTIEQHYYLFLLEVLSTSIGSGVLSKKQLLSVLNYVFFYIYHYFYSF